ncbi:MAG: Smr/MutS family protein [Candidatus Puniceispirillaceae bacterium]
MAPKKYISGKNNAGRRLAKHRSIQIDEDSSLELWAEVTNTVRRQPSSRISPVDLPALRAKKTAPIKKTVQTAKTSGDLHLRRTSKADNATDKAGHVTGPANLAMPVYAGIDRRSAKKIQQGKMGLDARIDLHGLSQLQARQRLQSFINRSVEMGLRTVLVITGKGKAGRGVLRENVPHWLSEPPLSEAIIAFGPSQPQDGGAGALYVRLKRAREG